MAGAEITSAKRRWSCADAAGEDFIAYLRGDTLCAMSDSQVLEAAGAATAPASGSARAKASRFGVAALFMTAGTLHFTHESFYTPTVPDSLPNPKQIVYISGVAEFLGGLGVLIPRTRRFAGLGLLALLVAVFPANINMAVNSDRFKQFPAAGLWARLPLQFVAMRWVWRATQRTR